MKLYTPSNTLLLDIEVDDTSVRYRSIMQDNNLTLNFSTVEPVSVPVGSYCTFEGQRYTLFYPENFKKVNTRNFEYTLVLHSHQEALKLYKFKDLSAKPYRLKFPLTAKPFDFVKLLVDNLNKNDSGWSVGSYIDADDKLISFNHEYCYDVLNRIAQEFNTEWEIENKTIHLRKIEKFKDTPLPLSYGKGNGFKSGVARQNDGDKQPIGKLYVQGGDRNIDYSTYGSSTLLLPKSATLDHDGKTYKTDVDGMYITRQGNNNVAEDSYDASSVYPKRVGTVSSVIVADAEKNFYDIIDTSIPENLNYRDCRIAGEKATIVFQSGALAGREFDILQSEDDLTGYDHAQRKFEIVPAELDGMIMPGGVFVPKVGDKYAIFNISMPQAYISDNATKSGASWDMFKEAVKYFSEHEDARFTFRGELDGMWSNNKWLQIGGKITLGGHILFSDTQFLPNGEVIRIVSIKDYVNTPFKPEITLSNAPVSGSFGSTLGKLEAEEVVIERNRKEGIQYTKRQWRDTKETMSMLQESLLNFSSGINPITIQTMQLVAGDESLQFRFVNSKTAPIQVAHSVTFNKANKQLTANAGIIQHMTIGIDKISPTHKPSAYKYWDMARYVSPPLNENKPYYLYAKCSKSSQSGTFLLSTTAIELNSVSGFYHLLMGVINSEVDNDRSIGMLYGFSEITPARITTPVLTSPDGEMYIDLLNKVIKGNIKFVSGGKEEDLGSWAGGVKDDIQGVDDKVEGLETGGGNFFRKDTPILELVTSINVENRKDNGFTIVAGNANKNGGVARLKDLIKSNGWWVISGFIKSNTLSGSIVVDICDHITEKAIVFNSNEYTRFECSAFITNYDTSPDSNNFVGLNFPNYWVRYFFKDVIVQKGNKATSWSPSPDDIKKEIEAVQLNVNNVSTSVNDLNSYVDNAFKDGIISEAEAKAIAAYINTINDSMAKSEASYLKVFTNTYLEGTAKTTLANAKINLWGQRDTLLNTINNAIADGKTTIAEKNAVDAQFRTFNNLMSAFQSALEDANKAIQDKLKGYSDDALAKAIKAEQDASNAQNTANTARSDVGNLNSYVDNAFKDGIISEAEAKAIATYINTINDSMAKSEASYLKVFTNTYLEGTAKTTLANAKINLWGQRDTLLNTINNAIADGKTTIAEKNAVDAQFRTFNNLMSAFQSALEDANKAIQNKLDSIAKGRVDNLQIGSTNYYKKQTNILELAPSVNVENRNSNGITVVIGNANKNGGSIRLQNIITSNGWWTFSGYVKSNSLSGIIFTDICDIATDNNIHFNSYTYTRFECSAFVTSYEENPIAYHFIDMVFPDSWVRYFFKDLKVEKGNKATDWSPATEDVQSDISKAQADASLSRAITDNFGTTIDGGLVSTVVMLLREFNSSVNTAGLSGHQGASRNMPSFWSGGTYEQAIGFIQFLDAIESETSSHSFDYKTEYAALAKITLLHNGAAKIGDFIIQQSGRIIMIDPDLGIERLVFTTDKLPTLESLLQGSTSSGSRNIGAGSTSTSQTLSGTANVEIANGNATMTDCTITISATGRMQSGGFNSSAQVSLILQRNGSLYREIGSTLIRFSDSGYKTESRSFDIPSQAIKLGGIGDYTFRLVTSHDGDVYGRQGTSTAFTFGFNANVQGVKHQQYGSDGMMFYYSNNHFYFTEDGGLDVRGLNNIPGPLASGTVNSNGSIMNAYGDKLDGYAQTITGGYKIYLKNLEHNKYSVVASPLSGTSAFRIGTKTNTYFEIFGTGGADFIVMGKNYP